MTFDRSSTAERRELLAKATPGAWQVGKAHASHLKGNPVTPIHAEDKGCAACGSGAGQWLVAWLFKGATGHSAADAALIVAAVNDYTRHLDMEDTLAELLRLIRVSEDGSDQSYLTVAMERARHLLTGDTDHGK